MKPKDFQITCFQVRASLADYLEGVPLGESREMMREHMESCAACKLALRDEKLLLDELGRLERMAAPAGFAERTLAAILPEIHPRAAILPRLLRGLSMAAALFLLVMILIRAFHPENPEVPGPLVDVAAQTLLDRGDQIGEGFRTLGKATGSFSDALEPVKVVSKAGGLIFGSMPPAFLGIMIAGALLPVLLVLSIVLRYRLKGAMNHVQR